MSTLIVTCGLPRSGKSTHALKLGFPIVSPDAIRLALHGQRYVQLAEPFVWATAQVMARSLFKAGHDTVIVDACSISFERRQMWMSHDWQVQLHVLLTSKDECIRRAHMLKDFEIVPIIERMAREFEMPTNAEGMVCPIHL
jgi:predicted kinase